MPKVVPLTLSNSSFTGNQAIGGSGAEGEGGALLFFPGATVSIRNSSFTGNLAQGGTGLGGFGGGVLNNGGTVTLTNSTLTANRAIGGTGTGVAPPVSTDNAGVGGGILNSGGISAAGISTSGNFTLANCTLTGNQAIGGSDNPFVSGTYDGDGRGGGIENDSENDLSTLTIINSTLFDNLAQGGTNSSGSNGQGLGGGINNFGAILSITNSALIGNQAVGAAGGSGVAAGDGFGGGLDVSNAFATNGDRDRHEHHVRGQPGQRGCRRIPGPTAATASAAASRWPSAASWVSRTRRLCPSAAARSTGNVAQGGAGGSRANGGNGWGGGLFVGAGGSALLQQTTVTANTAMGGLPGTGGSDGDGIGGGLYVATGASVFLKKTKVTGNFASTSNNNIYGTVTDL